MRVIKFRAWHKQERKMYLVVGTFYSLVSLSSSWEAVNVAKDVVTVMDIDAVELMQFTGLKDKHGKEIYEGDILRMGYGDGSFHEEPSVVKFGLHWVGYDSGVMAAGPALGFYFSPYPYHGDDLGVGEHFNWEHPDYYEVIGNIYDNPELLKE